MNDSEQKEFIRKKNQIDENKQINAERVERSQQRAIAR